MNIKKDIETFAHKYNFSIDQSDDPSICFLGGKINIIDPKEGFLWDSFYVMYSLDLSSYYDSSKPTSKSYPQILPKVYLLNHDELKIPERHIDSKNKGLCCLAPNTECQLILGKNYSLIDFTEKLVKPFFVSQVIFDKTGKWPYGDYKHYTEGLIEYYSKRLEIYPNQIVSALEILLEKKVIPRNELCFCGSGKKYKNCHRNILDNIKYYVNKNYLLNDYNEITKSELCQNLKEEDNNS